MKIKSIKAKCFLSIGTTPIEIDFTKLGNIINIRGINHDRKSGSSNGACKSGILEIIVYSLYGKVMKKMTHKEVLNNKIKKDLKVEIIFEKNNHNYHIIRCRKPDSLELWIDNEKNTLGGMPATQEEIEKIIGLTYDAFINITFFGQHNQKPFLSCTPLEKRQIVENLLSLEKYNQYCQTTKDKKKIIENEIKENLKDYENIEKNIQNTKKRLSQLKNQEENWKIQKNNEIESIKKKLNELETTNTQELEKLTSKISSEKLMLEQIKVKILEFEEKLDNKKILLHETTIKIANLSNSLQNNQKEIEKSDKILKKLETLSEGEECPLCHGIVGKENYHHLVDHHQNLLPRLNNQQKDYFSEKESLFSDKMKINGEITKLKDIIEQCNVKIKQITKSIDSSEHAIKSSRMPLEGVFLLQMRETLTLSLNSKESEINPFLDMIEDIRKEIEENNIILSETEKIIKEKEELLPYYDFWIKGFGDGGIRKLIIDDIIPTLNNRINYWLQFLIDNQIKLTFDNNLLETIENNPPDGDAFVYNGLSGGEHGRIDLAISQAFAYLMMLSSGTTISLVALDEVATYQDRVGVQCIYKMLEELSTQRQVLIITHDQDLLALLESADAIVVEKKNGWSSVNTICL